MLKIGIADLDTSHPGRWVPILQEWNDVAVVACWDGGNVRPPGYAEQFAAEHNIPAAVPALTDLIPLVDVVFVQSCNWDLHAQRVRPFVEAGKGVYIDKPLAGNVADLLQLKEWVAQGADIIGGSSLRCCEEVKRIHAQTQGSDLQHHLCQRAERLHQLRHPRRRDGPGRNRPGPQHARRRRHTSRQRRLSAAPRRLS